MSRRIYRYRMDTATEVEIPAGAAFVGFGFQEARQEFSAWFMVNTDEVNVRRRFVVVATGENLPKGQLYPHGSCVMSDGFHVFHLVEVL